MAKKISELTAADPLTGDELVEVSQGTPTLASKKTTVSDILALAGQVMSLLGLNDTPNSYAGQAGKQLRVNSTQDGIEFVAEPFTMVAGWNGKPSADQVLMRAPMPIAVKFAVNFAGSIAIAETGATAQTDFLIQKNGATVCTLSFAAGASTGTFTAATVSNFAAGDVLKLVAPGTADATLANLGITLYGER